MRIWNKNLESIKVQVETKKKEDNQKTKTRGHGIHQGVMAYRYGSHDNQDQDENTYCVELVRKLHEGHQD